MKLLLLVFGTFLVLSTLPFSNSRLVESTRRLDQFFNLGDESTEGENGEWGEYEADPFDPKPSEFTTDDDSTSGGMKTSEENDDEGTGSGAHRGESDDETSNGGYSDSYSGSTSTHSTTGSSSGSSSGSGSGGTHSSPLNSHSGTSSGYSSSHSVQSESNSGSSSSSGGSKSTFGENGKYSGGQGDSNSHSGGSDSHYSGSSSTSSTNSYSSATTSHSGGSTAHSNTRANDFGGYGGSASHSTGTNRFNIRKFTNKLNVKVPLLPVLSLFIFLAILAMLLTACQHQYNPEGIFTSCCRLHLNAIACVAKVAYNLYHCRLGEIPPIVFAMDDSDDLTDEELQRMKLRPNLDRALGKEHSRVLQRTELEIKMMKKPRTY